MAATVRIVIMAGEPRLHIWCDGCMTSARVEVDALQLTESGVRVLGTYRFCRRCDGGN